MRKRDSNIIYRNLGIIKNEYHNLITISKYKKYKIDKGILDKLTLSTRERKFVNYDIKKSFPRISHDELQECRDTAVGNFLSGLELKKTQKNAKLSIDRPRVDRGIIPRTIIYNKCFTIENNTLILRDSLDTNWDFVNGLKKHPLHDKQVMKMKLSIILIK